MQAKVKGPQSGLTYGAEAWIQLKHDLNNGKNYLINFTWEPKFADTHYNHYYIQITDGFIPLFGDLHWPDRYPPLPPITETDIDGTTNLLRLDLQNTSSPGKLNQSITIDCSGIVKIYSEPDAKGSILYESTLNKSCPWHVRFMVSDGTSSGFPAGEAQLNLYSFSIEELIP